MVHAGLDGEGCMPSPLGKEVKERKPPNFELMAKAARECEKRARAIAEAAENKDEQKLAWGELMGSMSFGAVTDNVEVQIRNRMLDLAVWERQARGHKLFSDWLATLPEKDREEVLLGTQEAHA